MSTFQGHEVAVAVTGVVVLDRDQPARCQGVWNGLAIPTYVFIVSMLGMVAWGFLREFLGDGLPDAATAEFTIIAEEPFMAGLGGLAFAFLLLRAFASGCATLTGVEAIANGVPAFRPPKGKNAATTLLILGAVATTLAFSIVVLANLVNVRIAEDPRKQLLLTDGSPVGDDYHRTRSWGSWRG